MRSAFFAFLAEAFASASHCMDMSLQAVCFFDSMARCSAMISFFTLTRGVGVAAAAYHSRPMVAVAREAAVGAAAASISLACSLGK
jgi:hypothetical protein